MVQYGEWPVVLQKETRDGILVPVGLAEASSLGNLFASSVRATTVSATNWVNLPTFGGSFTGVIDVCSIGSGTPIFDSVYNSDTLFIKALAVNNFGSFLSVTTTLGNEIQINYQAPLPVNKGGTGISTIPGANSVIYSNGTSVTGEGTFSYNGGNLSVATGFQINGTAIGIEDLFDGTTQVPNTGEVLTWAGSNWEPAVPTGGISVPNTADQILVSVNSTTVTGEPALTYNTTTNTINFVNASATTNVCASVFVENGTSLTTKYQAADATLTTIASQNPGANSYIYFTGTNTAATGTITSLARDLLNDAAASDMRATIELDISNFDDRILYVTNLKTLSATPPPTENTFLKYNSADGYHWTGVTGAGGSITVPNTPDQIVISVNSTTTTGDADFTYNSTTNTINFVNANATTNVCAAVFVENGTSLINTYLTIANATATYQPAGSYLTSPVSLTTQVNNILPIANGGTNQSSFVAHGIVYKDSLLPNATLVNAAAFTYTESTSSLKVVNASATNVCATVLVENGTSLINKYLTIANATATYQPTGSYLTTGDAALTYQPLDADLTNIAGLTYVANSYIYTNGFNAFVTGSISTCGVAILDDANFSDMRNTLGLSALATKSQVNLNSADITDTLQIANGGTNANSLANTHGVTFFDGTRLNTDSDLTFLNNLLSTSAFSATIASAGSFVENGTLLASKYLTISNATATYQPLDADLTTLASVATTGVLIFTAGNFASLANGAANTFLKYTGTSYIWTGTDGTATTPAGSNTQIQYNNNGEFGADAGLYWTTGTSRLNALSFSSPAVTATAIVWKGVNLDTTMATFSPGDYSEGGVLFYEGTLVDSTGLFTYNNTTNRLSVSAVSATVYNNIALSSQLTDVQVTGATTGQVLKWNGTKWAPAADDTGAGSNAAGSDGNVQYNNGGTLFGGDESFNFNDTTKVLSVTTASATTVSAGTIHVGGSDGIIRNLNGSINISALNGSISISAVNSVKLQGIEIDSAQWPQAGTGPAVAFYSDSASSLLNVRLNSSVINGTRDAQDAGPPQGYIAASYLTSANDQYFALNPFWNTVGVLGSQDLPSNKDVLMYNDNIYGLSAFGAIGWTWDKLSLSGGYLTDVATTAPTINKVLAYNGSQWAPTSDLIVDSITATTYNNLPPSVAGISYIMGNNLF